MDTLGQSSGRCLFSTSVQCWIFKKNELTSADIPYLKGLNFCSQVSPKRNTSPALHRAIIRAGSALSPYISYSE